MIESILLLQAPSAWQQASWIAGTVGVLVAAVSLAVSAIANERNARAREATFWLDLRRMFASHDKEVHRKLRRGGEWTNPGKEGEPAKGSDGEADLIAYMGLFEHCEYMLDDGLIAEKTFKKIYAYRLNALLKNDRVKQKLADYKQGRFDNYKSWGKDDEGGWYALKELLQRCEKLDKLQEPLREQPSSEPST